MTLGLIQYLFGQKYLSQVGDFIGNNKSDQGEDVLKKPLTSIEKDRLVVLFLSFILVIVFWGAFEQAGGLMNIYASEKTDRLFSKNL